MCMGIYGHPLSLTKHAFFVWCMYRGNPKHHPNIWGHLNILGVSKHTGVSKHRIAHKHTGASKHMEVSKHTGRHMGDIQRYQGAIQTYGGIWTPLSLTKHSFFVLCMYMGHPNIWGGTFFCIILNYIHHPDFLILNISSIFSKYS